MAAIRIQSDDTIPIDGKIARVHSQNLEELVARHLLEAIHGLAEFLVENFAKLFKINRSFFRETCVEEKLSEIMIEEYFFKN